ncbi:MAG: alkaline phosphatase family protein [Verrucomicrobiae bacterium]|nr:alkaline phosphatase family protein [Verrucomicrobiae bacterium]
MFRSLASSLITLFIVILAGLLLLFITKGSADLSFKRVAMAEDRPTKEVLNEYIVANTVKPESVDVPDTDMTKEEPEVMAGGGPKVVLWISIPGFRGDYIENSDTPFFDRMIQEGASTTKLRPNFPCLDFPAHASLATGTLVDKHGIPLDRFRIESGEFVDHPLDQSLLLTEPIWTTATRQGIRTLVHDWPLSQKQGENATAYSLPSYDPALTDQQRLDALWNAWSNDKDENKLRLLMIRLNGIFEAGMKNGPRETGTYKAVSELDGILAEFFKKVEENWATLAPKNGALSVVITTDHGLVDLDKNINLPQLLGPDLMKNLEVTAHDAVGHLFFKDLPENAAQAKIVTDNLDGELKKRIYFRTLTQDELPADWAYHAQGRMGDRVLVLKNGYAFTDATAKEPVFEPGEGPGLFGGFGYPVETSVRMSGESIIWGLPSSPASGDLGEINFQKYHATVCKLLGIQPAEGAVTETLPVE